MATSSPSASRPYIPIVPSCATLPNLLTPYAFNTSITATSSSSSATQTSLSTISPPTHRPILPALPGKSAKYTANLAALARLVSKVQKQHTHSPEHKAVRNCLRICMIIMLSQTCRCQSNQPVKPLLIFLALLLWLLVLKKLNRQQIM